MARNEMPDQDMENRLREHFAEEARELRAPDDLWARLEGRLGEQQPPRFASLRGGVAAIGEMPWIPAAAAAVLVVGVGIGAWALSGGVGDGGGDDDDDAAIHAAAATEAPREAPAEMAAATEAAAAESTVVAAAPADAPDDAETRTESVRQATQEAVQRVEEAPTEAPSGAEAPAAEATPAPTAVAEPTAAATEAPPPDDTDDSGAAPVEPDSDDMADGDMAGDDMGDADMGDDMGDADMGDDMGDADMGDDMDADMSDDGSMDEAPAVGDVGGGPSEPSAEEKGTHPEQPPATTFQDYERTGVVDTSTDAVSTFSLDTDRTSYFLALTWVRDGYTVNPDSVRAEEWINSFDYDYAEPGDDSRFAITSDLVRHPLESGWHLARVALQAPDLRDDRPLNVTLVLDASGSMGTGNRVAVARAAAEAIRASLDPDDRVAVVHFSSHVIHAVGHSRPDNRAVVRAIEWLRPHSSTNVQAGLNQGVRLADAVRRERPDAYNYIILMSDGVANVDATDPFAILEGAPDTDSRNPLRLITIGVGIENYNDVLLEQLAQYGNGWYRYLDTVTQAQLTFSRENWLALSTPFADQARAQVTWDPAVVKSWRIVGYENRITPDHTFEQDRKEFAELPSGTATTVFYELKLHEGVSPSAVLGGVEVRWVDPATGASRSQAARVTGRTDAGFAGADRYLRLGAIVGLAADRYSSLSPQVENAAVDYAGISDDLDTLGDELAALQGSLGSTQAYQDFDLLLRHLAAEAEERAPSSGYSR